MWYDSGSSEEGATAIFLLHKQQGPHLLLEILMPWMLTGSISLPLKEPNICTTTNVSSATKRDVICPNIKDTLKKEENPLEKEHVPPGG